jgi:hypothetical protein
MPTPPPILLLLSLEVGSKWSEFGGIEGDLPSNEEKNFYGN